MFSMVVAQCFDAAQNKVYGFELSISNSNIDYRGQTYKQIETVKSGENPYPGLSRLLGVPIAIIDLSLECICSVAQAIEGVACLIFSTLMLGIRLEYWDDLKTNSRVFVCNLHDAMRSIVNIPVKVISAPLIALAQMGLILLDPQKALPTYQAILARAELFADSNHIVENRFNEFKKGLFRSAKEYAGYGLGPKGKVNPNPHPIKSRVYALPLAIIDPLLDSLRSLCGIVYDVFTSAFFFIAAPFVFALSREGYKNGVNTYRIALIFLSFIPSSLTNCVTKLGMLPITMIAQIGSILSDPRKIAPSKNWLYMSQVGDRRVAMVNYRLCIEVKSHGAGSKTMWKQSATH